MLEIILKVLAVYFGFAAVAFVVAIWADQGLHRLGWTKRAIGALVWPLVLWFIFVDARERRDAE